MTRYFKAEPSDWEAGFTLLEMLVGLAIVAVVVSLGIPHMARRTEPNLEGLTSRIAAELRQARTLAITHAEARRVTFDVAATTIEFAPGDVLDVPPAIKMTITTGDRTVVAKDRAVLIFLPDGSASGIAITLADTFGRRELRVHWLTGLVSRTALKNAT